MNQQERQAIYERNLAELRAAGWDYLAPKLAEMMTAREVGGDE